ncbi:MAG: zf-TFIIB domain-containing protein [Betaproteobacteria bacterium]
MAELAPGDLDTSPRGIDCPRCTASTRILRLSAHKGQPIAVDHCPACRLVWFDALESVHLDGLGWLRLLREMQDGTRLPLADAVKARPACPRCTSTLRPVRNRSRFGTFAVLECPSRHGHLQGHTSLLAERGLVRPLGIAERSALASERHSLHCLNCGGAAASGDDQCSYCGTALVVFDLPRLAHSLRLRLTDMGPSPRELGRHVAWACRGCGAALDPGRDVSCRQCTHMVVAHELPDIDPLLDAAEADLDAAAQAEARRLARYPSTHARRAAGAGQPRPVETPSPLARRLRALMWFGWSPLLLLLAVAVAVAIGVLADVPWPPRTPIQALRAQPLGDDPSAAWAWVEAHRLVAPADGAARAALRRGLFVRYAAQLTGAPWPADATVGSLIDGMPVRGLQGNWDGAVAHSLRMVWPADAPPPEEAGTPHRGGWERVAPAAWLDAEQRNSGVWAPTFENASASPLSVIGPLHLKIMVTARDGVPWHCVPARSTPAVIRSGQHVQLVCRTTVLVSLQQDLWAAAMRQLRAGEPAHLEWQDEGVATHGDAGAVIDNLVADATARSVPLDKFLRRHTALRDGVAPPATVATAATPVVHTRATISMRERWTRLPSSRQAALVVAFLMAALVAYCTLARWRGERRATWALLIAAAPLCFLLGRGEGPASVLLVGMYVSLSAILSQAYAFVYRVYREAVFRRFG